MNFNLIILSIPLYFLLIGLEVLIDKLNHRSNYRFNDAITNISCGMGEQVTGVFFKLFIVGLYSYLYARYAFFHIPLTWLSWLILFLSVDFFYYWFHRYSHVINLFWGGHVVHHQSEEYNLSVALRQGWFQKFFSFGFYLPLALIGFSPVQFLTVSSLVTLYQFWIHTRSIGKLGIFEYIFNTPSHHRVHHGVNPKYIDKNHAGTLIIWDRMFGTFQEEEEEPRYGITQPVNTWDPVEANLQHWKGMYKGLQKMKGSKDKLRFLFMPPGWKPAYIIEGGKDFDPVNYKKFDTQVSASVNYYVLFQYAVTLAGATFFLFSKDLSIPDKLIACGLVIISIVNYSNLFESKNYAVLIEAGRILLTIAFLLGWYQVKSPLFIVGYALWLGISGCWLFFLRTKSR
jgi:alkylglycerol monooxygenase